MGVDYHHPHRRRPPEPQPAAPAPHAPEPAPPRGEPALRSDIARAVGLVPPHIRAHLDGDAAAALAMLNRCLPGDEPVERITSVAATVKGPPVCVLAITDHRLVFVAPAPQAVAWRLSSLKKSQVYMGYFFIEGDAGDYSLGLADDDWGRAFEHAVKKACAEAVLARR